MKRPVGVKLMNSASVELRATGVCFFDGQKTGTVDNHDHMPGGRPPSSEIVSEEGVTVTFHLK
ncbi:hypothetical protein E4U19_002942 [Claviceps sp. Clav32 group G5]|nr:hypothetical protein E4U19_002942 [Claviceps sp. Clav32 group G5]